MPNPLTGVNPPYQEAPPNKDIVMNEEQKEFWKTYVNWKTIEIFTFDNYNNEKCFEIYRCFGEPDSGCKEFQFTEHKTPSSLKAALGNDRKAILGFFGTGPLSDPEYERYNTSI